MATPTTIYRIQPARADLSEESTGLTVFTFTVTRSSGAGTGGVAYHLQNITTSQADFVGATTGVVRFAAGEVSKTISITVAGDSQIEGDELFGMVLTDPVGEWSRLGVRLGASATTTCPASMARLLRSPASPCRPK